MPLSDQLLFINNHWTDKLINPNYKRHVFKDVVANLDSKNIINLVGPRRVGKTTLLSQLINHLIYQMNLDPKCIIYFSFDLYNDTLIDILNKHSILTQINYRKQTVYLILDEIQYLTNWASHVKFVYDNQPNIKIIISGSSSSELLRGKESLAGREIILKVDPLAFQKYMDLTNTNTSIDHFLWQQYLIYMDRQLPELALNPETAKEKISSLVDKVINYDLTRIYNLSETQTLYNLFRVICKSPGEIINYGDLAKDFGVTPQTIRNYLKYLEDVLLIRKLYNYTKNARKSEKSKKRFYPYFTTLHLFAHPYPIEFGKKAETEVAFQINAQYFWNYRTKEIDFIIGDNLDVGVEVKMRNTIRSNQYKWLIRNEFTKKRIIICKYESVIANKVDGVEYVKLHKVKSLIEMDPNKS